MSCSPPHRCYISSVCLISEDVMLTDARTEGMSQGKWNTTCIILVGTSTCKVWLPSPQGINCVCVCVCLFVCRNSEIRRLKAPAGTRELSVCRLVCSQAESLCGDSRVVWVLACAFTNELRLMIALTKLGQIYSKYREAYIIIKQLARRRHERNVTVDFEWTRKY
jgi:hypothetical protein